MAIPIFKARAGEKGGAEKHSDYINRLGKYAKLHSDEKLEFAESFNMPQWAIDDPKKLWNAADEFERKNGTAYRRYVVSIPRELNLEQRKNFAVDLVKKEFGDKHPLSLAIHNKTALDGGEQPHLHIMVCERTLDGIERAPDQFFKRYNSKNPERGGAKKANTGLAPAERKALMKEQRHRVGDIINHHLELSGSDVRVDMRTLKEQGIDRLPINLSMEQITNPRIQKIYVEDLQIRRAVEKAEKDVEDLLDEREIAKTARKINAIEYRLPALDRYTNLPDRLAYAGKSRTADTERAIELTKSDIASTDRTIESTKSDIANSERIINESQSITDTIHAGSMRIDIARSDKLLPTADGQSAAINRAIELRKRKISESVGKLNAPKPTATVKPKPEPSAFAYEPPAPKPTPPAPKPMPSLAEIMQLDMLLQVRYIPVGEKWSKTEKDSSYTDWTQQADWLKKLSDTKRLEFAKPINIRSSRSLSQYEHTILHNLKQITLEQNSADVIIDVGRMPVDKLKDSYPTLKIHVDSLELNKARLRPEPLVESTAGAEVEPVEQPRPAPAADVEKPTPTVAPRPKPRGP